MRGNPWRWSRARHSAGTVRRRRTMDAVLRLVSDGVNADRKRIGSGSDILYAHPCAALSQEKLRIRPYKEPVREGIQSPRVTAHVLARLTDSTNSPVLLSSANPSRAGWRASSRRPATRLWAALRPRTERHA